MPARICSTPYWKGCPHTPRTRFAVTPPYLLALNEHLIIDEKLSQSLRLVADPHFGVREMVWMALRPEIDRNLTEAIQILSKWTNGDDENIRRFTTESTRPRGVWCKHLEALKNHPELALPILEPPKSDGSKYVHAVNLAKRKASNSPPAIAV